jgi:leucyl-tRNA synthetase
VFGCPAHDQRDLDFANKYALKVTPVVLPKGDDAATFAITDTAYTDDGVMINSRFLDGMTPEAAFNEVANRLEQSTLGNQPQAARKVQFRLRDWGISRQRYWGCPIPMIHCESCGVNPVPRADLPVKLPDDVDFDRPGNPLDRHATWRHVKCPKCGGEARRETDTMDTFVDSSWYYARFTAPWENEPTDRAIADRWLPVDQYIGGVEHAILHLLYSRFFTRAMKAMLVWMSLSRACSRRAWSCTKPTRPMASGLRLPISASRTLTANARQPCWRAARRSKSVPSRRCRSRRRMSSIPTISFLPMVQIPRAGSCCPIRRLSVT